MQYQNQIIQPDTTLHLDAPGVRSQLDATIPTKIVFTDDRRRNGNSLGDWIDQQIDSIPLGFI